MKLRLPIAVCLAALLVILTPAVHAAPGVTGPGVTAEADFAYTAGPGESRETARALALYGARQKIVSLCAERLAAGGVLKDYGNRRMAIFCLVNDAMTPTLLDASFDATSRTWTVNIKGTLSLADFVRAEIRNQDLNRQEQHFTLKEEMEPSLSPTIAPALELSRAYRYVSNRHWRMAIIYMDHLETKYAHWGALYLAKAEAYLGMHEQEKALSALRSACYLGVQEACMQINVLDPPD